MRLIRFTAGPILLFSLANVACGDSQGVEAPTAKSTARSSQGELAMAADAFVRKAGVNLGFDTSMSALQNASELGIRSYRASLEVMSTDTANAGYATLGLSGDFLGLGVNNPSVASTAAVVKKLSPGAIRFLEGPNEVNNTFGNGLNFKYNGKENAPAAIDYMNDVWRAFKADPALASVPIAAFTQVSGDNVVDQLAGTFPFDLENEHPYPPYGPVTYAYGEPTPGPGSGYGSMIWGIGDTDARDVGTGPQKGITATETGYSVARMSTLAQAKYTTRLLANYLGNDRIDSVFLFVLADQEGYGLLDGGGARRPAYNAVKGFLGLLSDADWDGGAHVWSTVPFTPQSLGYSATGGASTIAHKLLQKSNGDFYLLAWNEVPVNGVTTAGANGPDVHNAPVPLSFTFDRSFASITTYTQADDGSYAAMDLAAGTTVSLKVPDGMLIVRLSGSAATNPPVQGSPSTGPAIVGIGGKCLDVAGGDGQFNNGRRVQIWDCLGNANQTWTYDAGRLIGLGGKCLDVAGGDGQFDNGRTVQMYDCLPNDPNQQWTYQNGQIVGLGGKCLDVTNQDSTSGTAVQMWDCWGGPNQQWTGD